MTSPVHGSVADLYYNGKKLSDYFKSASFSASRDTAETTTFKKSTKTYIPGLLDSTLSAEGLLHVDSTATGGNPLNLGIEANLSAALASASPVFVSYFPAGAENGNEGYSLYCHETSLEVNSDIGDVVQVSCEFQGSDAFMRGKVVATGSPASPSSHVDGGIGVVNGRATAVVQVTASTSLVLRIQDSADNVTYADVGATLAASTAGSYIIERTNVRRYVRLAWTGSGTFTALLSRDK